MDGDEQHSHVNALIPLNCALKKGYDGKFCYVYFTIFKNTEVKQRTYDHKFVEVAKKACKWGFQWFCVTNT